MCDHASGCLLLSEGEDGVARTPELERAACGLTYGSFQTPGLLQPQCLYLAWVYAYSGGTFLEDFTLEEELLATEGVNGGACLYLHTPKPLHLRAGERVNSSSSHTCTHDDQPVLCVRKELFSAAQPAHLGG